ncbi:WSCD family member GA21586-like [Littorina saxatilis]|uniref:Sulfotransferase n=1 Tax=Littorina saxatilis TaxID=31220 RepID=A0AAN9AY08_9CAEN
MRGKWLFTKRQGVKLLAIFLVSTLTLTLLSQTVRIFLPTILQLSAVLSPHAPCTRNLSFSSVPLPVTALASVQGSGNTWMRHLLQQLSGVYTGSVYNRHGDPELWAQGYYGEGVANGSVVAVKNHGTPGFRGRGRYKRAIVVIRNPYDAMFADFNRRATGSHTGVALLRSYALHWNDFCKEYALRWTKFHSLWLNFKGPLLIINFDDLTHSLEKEVHRISRFIAHPSLHLDIACALADSRGGAKRKVAPFDKSEAFSVEQIEHVNKNIRAVQAILRKKFTEVAAAISVWQRNATGTEQTWLKLLKVIS